MSGIQSIEGTSVFELQTTRTSYPVLPVRQFESGSAKIDYPAAIGKQEKNFDFQNLSEEDRKRLEEELKKVNDSLVPYEKQIRFRYNEEAKQTYVEVIDMESQKVVASMPPEFLIDLSIKMREMIGLFMDKKL